jgi:asparaginyl-tRNA synthetase
LRNLQLVAEHDRSEFQHVLEKICTGCSLSVEGTIRPSPGKGQGIELHPSQMRLCGWADPAFYPLQKKRHSFEFLREIAHLRPRTNTIGAVARVRNRLTYAIHQFFQERGFFYIHTPIITASDCEGAGEAFRVTVLDPENAIRPLRKDHPAGFWQANLSYGQRATSGSNIYAWFPGQGLPFGPTFARKIRTPADTWPNFDG